MATHRKNSTLDDPFKLTILIFAVIAFMYFTGEVLRPLALSILLSFALVPAVRFLEHLGLPRAAAVIMTVLVTLGLMGGIGYVVGKQLTSLARGLPNYQENIEKKLSGVWTPGNKSAAQRIEEMANQVKAKLVKTQPHAEEAEEVVPVQKVEVVQEPTFQERLRSGMGPYLEFLGIGSFVLILVLFMLIGREDLSDRIIGLFGHRQVSLTTRTMEEIGKRISRYLATFALVNSSYGLVVGMGLEVIGLPYAVLWGCMAAMLRFIPYVGPAVAFLLPLAFSFAYFPRWLQPLEVLALFGVIEVALNSFLEPVIYGKTTGVSALSLLVAAMFWTWLWGSLGLLLSTPLTLCLAVLGKYVPSLHFFATILGEDAELDPDVRFYQRLVALDRAGALEVVETALKKRPHVEVFQEVLIPALSRAKHDSARDELEDRERAFVWQVVGEILDGLEGVPDFGLASPSSMGNGGPASVNGASPAIPASLVGLVVQDTGDLLVLRMLELLLAGSGCTLEIDSETDSPLEVAERITGQSFKLIIVSHLPPEGLTLVRYLVRRLRAQCPEVPIVVGRWGETGAPATVAEALVSIGASQVVFSLADARERILKLVSGEPEQEEVGAAALPA